MGQVSTWRCIEPLHMISGETDIRVIMVCSHEMSVIACLQLALFSAQHNFTLVVLAIVLVSVLPIVFEIVAARREPQSGSQ